MTSSWLIWSELVLKAGHIAFIEIDFKNKNKKANKKYEIVTERERERLWLDLIKRYKFATCTLKPNQTKIQ